MTAGTSPAGRRQAGGPARVRGSADAGAPRRRHLRAVPPVPRAPARATATPTGSRSAPPGPCVGSVLGMLESGATHLGVATDHVIPSFRNDLWAGYKTGEGIDPELFAQFQLLEDALEAMGVAVWAMVDLEADDALASSARGRGRRPPRRAGDHLHPRQGPRPVRRRQGRAARPAQGDPARRRRRARQVRRRARVDSRLSRARGRQRRRLPRPSRDSARRRAAALLQPLRPRRGDPRRRPRVGRARACAASTGSRPRSPPAARSSRASRCSRRCAPTPTSAPSTTGAGPGRPTTFGDWCERLGAPRLLARARALAKTRRTS